MSAFDVNNPAAVRMWGEAVVRDAERPNFFWVEPPPRLTRWQRLRAWVLRLLGRAPADATPIAAGILYGFQKTVFNAGTCGVHAVDTLDLRWEWGLNIGGTTFRVKAAAGDPITEQQALNAIEIRKGWPVGLSGQLVRVDSTMVSVREVAVAADREASA